MDIVSIFDKIFGKMQRNEFHARIFIFALLVASFVAKRFYNEDTLCLRNLLPLLFVDVARAIYTVALLLVDVLVVMRMFGEFWVNKGIVLADASLFIVYVFGVLQILSNLTGSNCGIVEYTVVLAHTHSAKNFPLYLGLFFVGVFALYLVVDIFTDADELFG